MSDSNSMRTSIPLISVGEQLVAAGLAASSSVATWRIHWETPCYQFYSGDGNGHGLKNGMFLSIVLPCIYIYYLFSLFLLNDHILC